MKLFNRKKSSNEKDELIRSYKTKYFKELEYRVRNVLYNHIDKVANKLEYKDFGYSVGSQCVIDKYNLTNKAYNSWDSGASYLLNILGENFVPIVKVTNIRADVSLAYEYVDQWIDKYSMDYFEGLSNDGIIRNFESYSSIKLNTSYRNWHEKLGIYFTTSYELLNSPQKNLQPINSNSFLNINSTAGMITAEVWDCEIEVGKMDSQLKHAKSKLKEVKNKLFVVNI